MRVLWLSHLIPYPPKAGVLLRAYYLLKAVAERHTVDLVAFVQEPWLDALFESREAGMMESEQALRAWCRSVTFLPIEKMQRRHGQLITAATSLVYPGGYMARWLQGHVADQTLAEIGASAAHDVVHFDTIALAPFRRHFPQCRATLGHHNIESHMLLRRAQNATSPVKKAYFWQEGHRLRRYERRVSGDFDLHITCSDLDGERLRQIAPGVETRTVPNGVDSDYFQPRGVPEKPHSLIIVGTMNWYPNVDAVLFLLREIWPLAKRRVPDLTLDIVGTGAPPAVVELARASPGVTLHGFVPEMRPMLEAAALYICPIRDGGGTKLKILDAFAMAKCVLAHPVACEGIGVTSDENVVFADSAEQFAVQIETLLADPARRARIGSAARQLAGESYSFAAIGAEFAGMLETLTSDGV